MRKTKKFAFHVAAGMFVLTACSAQNTPPAAVRQIAGWYNQEGSTGTFQPCGSNAPWLLTKMADLRARATAFGLQDGSPVYVKLSAIVSPPGKFGPQGRYSHEAQIERVVQFGSPTPVRNCALDGVVHPGSSPTVTSQ